MQYVSGRKINQDFGVPGITTNDTVVNVDGRIAVGIGTSATTDIDTNQIRIRDNIIDSRGVIGSMGYFLTKDVEGLTWTNVPPLGNNSIFLAEDGDILNNIGLQTYTGLNFISDQLLGITTNPDNPGFADIRIDPRWYRDRTPGGGGGIYTTGTVGIGLTQPRLGNVGVLTDVKLDVLGDAIFSGIISASSFIGEFNVDTQDLNVSGIASFNGNTDNVIGDTNTGIVQIDGGVGIDKNVSIGASLDVNNLLTVGSAVTIGNGIVSATTGDFTNLELDNLNVSGFSTFGDIARFNSEVNIFDDLFVSGNISVGGTGVTLDTETIRIEGKELLIGFTTTITPNDTTANAAGIAVASTEGYFLVDLQVPGINTTPNTYKQIKWFKNGTFVGQGTDAFISNQPISIGRTQIQNGQLFAVGNSINFTEDEITAPTFVGNLTGTASTASFATTAFNLSNAANITTGTISSDRLTGSYDIDITGTATTAFNLSDAANITTGTISSDRLTGSYDIDITGTATTATNLADAANITTGTISSDRLTGSYDIDITGTATTATNLADAANITTGTISSDRLTGSYDIDITGTATTATNLADAANITTGTISSDRLTGSYAIDITGTATTATNLSNAANITTGTISSDRLTGSYSIDITGTASTASFATTAFNLNGVVASNLNVAFAQTAGIATNLVGGVAGQISYQTAPNVTGFLTTGPSNQVLTSQGPGIAPIWTAVGSASAIEGITVRDEGSIVGGSGSISTLNFKGNGVIATATAGGNIATITISQSVDGSGGIANTATNLADAANITTGTISSDRLTGSYGIDITGTATTATNLSNAANITTGTISSDRLTGSYDIDITGNAGTASTASFATTAFNLNGVVASNLNVAFAQTAGLSTETTKLQTSRTFEITGDVVASPITFDGTGNVSLAATIQPNSVGLGTDTFGDYVKSITGTSNEVTVSVTSGEGSTPQIGLPSDVTIGQDLTVTRDVEINRNLNVNGNITIGGTSATLFTQTLTVADPDLILGVRTDALGNDISTDNTANHGGIAIASTEGNPLITLTNPGAGETLPSTYKKIMWFKSGSFSGLGTDAWLSNYAIGIGSTQFPTGTRLAAGSVQFTENDLAAVRNINSSGIVTASVGFEGNLTGTASTASFATTAFNLNGVVESDLNVATATTATNLSNAANITTGTISSDRLTGSYDIDITGTATTATNLSNAANITTGTISSDRLTGSYDIDITGTASTASFATTAFNLDGFVESNLNVAFAQTAGIATYTSEWILETGNGSDYGISGPGLTGTENDPTFYLTRGEQYKFTNNTGGHPFRIQSTPNGSVGTQYNDGITNNNAGNGTTLLWNVQFDSPDILYYQCTTGGHGGMGGKIYIVNAGIASDVNLFTTGIATIGSVQINAGIVTATSGIVTYYGDGQYLQNISSSGGISSITISNNTLDQSQYLTYAVSTGNTTGLGVTTEGLVFNPFTGRMGIGQTLPQAKLDINVGTGLTALNIEGSEGQLFSITNNLTSGSIFSVNDVSGIPSIDVDADGTIQLAPFGSTEYVGIGTTNPTQKLDVNGNIRLRGALYDNSNGIGATNQVLTSTGSGISWQDAAVSGVGIQSGGTVIGTGITTLNFVGAGNTFALNGNTVDISIVTSDTTRTVNTYTATSAQTTFSATYNVGYVDVFLNGVKLSENEYTATNGTSIVLDTGASLNDIVEVVGYSNINISGSTPDISPIMMGMIF
ncbi:hypothetical protein SWZG_00010 [Synechococcus phage S-SKS1]|uniref:Uncharacterized protein n=1 Tax=Synechococcus phage S-SKS1 TaxID=754042 RepID=M4QRQ4_9CAUD|nr:baseplate wedge subunit [Synechococcus phage S-SKS1]AGH31523.1 hypothetical protein SWZG_00010 [Synechococcus phage S-SKS1]